MYIMNRADFDRLFDQYKNCEFSLEGRHYDIYKSEVKKLYSIDEILENGERCRLALCPSHIACLDVQLFNGKSFNEQFSDIIVDWVS